MSEPSRDSLAAALLHQIVAAPDDPTPRRILADILLEDGDPRGEFIALQCLDAPTATQRKRAITLLRLHWQTWIHGLAGLADFRTVRFVGGFLHSVSLRRAPLAEQRQVTWPEDRALIRHVEVVREFTPEEAPLTEVLPRLRGLQVALGLGGDEVAALLADPPALVELGVQTLDATAIEALLGAELSALGTLRVEARDRVELVQRLLTRNPVRRLAVGHGELAVWRAALEASGLDRLDVRVPGWVLSLGGQRLAHLDAWPVPELVEDTTGPLTEALRAVPIRALSYIHVRGGAVPRRDRLIALRAAARGTPMLLPASWRRVLREDLTP